MTNGWKHTGIRSGAPASSYAVWQSVIRTRPSLLRSPGQKPAAFEKERLAGGTVEHAHEEAMRLLLHGLHFSPYALLTEVVEREFADEVAELEREAFCRDLYPI